MSRRKQEKPQPRKNLVKGEALELAQDILTCGVCRRDFPLCEIVRFIQHKVNTCNKENSCLNKLFSVIAEDSDSEDAFVALPHGKPPPLEELPLEDDVLNEVSSSFSPLKNAVAKDEAARDNAEPCSFICSTCKEPHTSAYALLQHVQNQHGLRIYVDSSSSQCTNLTAEPSDSKPTAEQCDSSPSTLRAPLLERQFDSRRHTPHVFPRSSSQNARMGLLSLSTASIVPAVQSSPPPLIEVHPMDSSPPSSSVGDTSEPQLDFYSKRLRELAGATSPNALVSSVKLLQPSFQAAVKNEPSIANEQSQHSTTSMPSHPPQSSASSTTSENPVSPKTNPRACDFCGKTFRFMSNLIVHRRSHTGEKPFKCHICNHACTQASKLKRHMKTHKRRKKSDKLNVVDKFQGKKNGVPTLEKVENNKNDPDGETNGGESEYASDEEITEKVNSHNEGDAEEEIDVEDDEDDDNDNDLMFSKKLTVDLGSEEVMVAEDLSKKGMKNGTVENNGICIEGEKKCREKSVTRHSLLSEVMEKIGLASIQQYSEAYKQALKESSILKQERHSDGGSASNDGANYLERPSRDGTRSAGQSPLSFNTGLLSAFDESMGVKRIKLEDHYRDKEDSSLYAGLWIPSVSSHSMSSYKDLYSADGSDRRKSKTESALNCMGLSCINSSSPRPGPSTNSGIICNIGTVTPHNSLLKPKDQRRNDTCEFCGKVFKNCSNLTVHRRSHTGEKPYKCELCSYACAQSSKLTRHMKTHGRMGKDVYRCRFCDMPFSVPSTLEKHMRKCVVSQSGGSSYLLAERESDSKEMTS